MASVKPVISPRPCTGSVKALTLHPTLPILASAGLDRTLRLHHTASRKLLAKVFLKSQLTGGRSTSSLGD